MCKSEKPAVKSQVCRHQAIKEKRKNEYISAEIMARQFSKL